MENRDRDKISKSTGSTPSGDINRKPSSHIESEQGSRQSGSIGSSGMQGDSGRRSDSSDIGSDVNKKSNRGGSDNESL